MRRLLLVFLLVVAPAASLSAQTLTTRDIVELTKAGLTEEVLLALIEVNRSVFPVDRDTLKSLKDSGVTANVIVAMVRSGREPVVPPAPDPQPQRTIPVVVHHDDGESERTRQLEREVERLKDRERERAPSRSEYRAREVVYPVAVPVYVPVPVRPREPVKRPEPVYWGWDGKLRPDAWQPETRKDSKDPRKDPRKKEEKDRD